MDLRNNRELYSVVEFPPGKGVSSGAGDDTVDVLRLFLVDPLSYCDTSLHVNFGLLSSGS